MIRCTGLLKITGRVLKPFANVIMSKSFMYSAASLEMIFMHKVMWIF